MTVPDNNTADRTEQAEERIREPQLFMRSVRGAPRRWTHTRGEYPDGAVRVPPGSDRFRPVPQVGDQPCQLLLVDQGSFDRLRTWFMEAGKERLTRYTVRDATKLSRQGILWTRTDLVHADKVCCLCS